MLLLGIDEGTTGVKAALFDERLQQVREARRDKVNRHPHPGGSSRTVRRSSRLVVEAVGELLEAADDEVVACGLDHQGESVLAWDAETGKPLSPIVVWQDKRSQEVLDRMGDAEEEIRSLSGLPFDPYFSAAKLAWLLEREEAVQRRPRGRDAAHGHRRLVPVRPARARDSPPTTPRPRARSCTGSARPGSTSGSASCSACPGTCCPRCATRPVRSAP